MNLAKNRYTLLMASLTPHEADLFSTRQALVSVFQLNKRLAWRLELRTLVAAVRYKHYQPERAISARNLVLTAFRQDILRNWQQADFGLRYRFPWLVEINHLIEQKHYWQLEQYLLKLAWQHYERQSQGHYFDFEAVVIYVLRWEVRHRLSQYEGQKARQRFMEILQQRVEEVV